MTTTDHHVFFYSGSVFSNFYWTKDQFRYGAAQLSFSSSEAAFMYAKALFFHDAVTASKIVAATSSFQAKSLGREVKGYVDKEWECVRLGYMQHVLLAKFSQNPEFAQTLKATGERVLVEASPTDRIWGIGVSEQEAAAGAPWQGRNLLGEALMTVRGML